MGEKEKITKGLKKFREAMNTDGYKKVCEKTGISKSPLYRIKLGQQPSEGITLRIAWELYKAYGIELTDWFEEAKE